MKPARDFIIERTKEAYDLTMGLDWDLALEVAEMVWELKDRNNKIIFMGNGASNTIATHGALDYMGQCGAKTVCVNDPSVITAMANDFGYDGAWERYVKINWAPGDILFCVSSSGNSPNVCQAAEWVREQGGEVIGFSGFDKDNRLARAATKSFWVDNKHYNIVECIHNLWVAMICDVLTYWMEDKAGLHGIEL